MKHRLKNLIVALTIALTGSMMLAPALVSADLKGDVCEGVNAVNETTPNSKTCIDGQTRVNGILATVVQIFSVIVGFVAVVMVIIGGLRLITANGDAGAVASARSSIIYALIGLIVVALAQLLVHFVLNRAT